MSLLQKRRARVALVRQEGFVAKARTKTRGSFGDEAPRVQKPDLVAEAHPSSSPNARGLHFGDAEAQAQKTAMSVGTLLSDVVGPDGQFYSLAPSHAPTIALSNPESDRSLHPVHPSRAHHPDMIPPTYLYEAATKRDDRSLDAVRAAIDRLEYELEERRRDDRTTQEEKTRTRKKKRMGESKKRSGDSTCIVVASAVAVVAIVVVLVLFLSCGGKKSETPSIVYHVYTQSAHVPSASYVLPPATAQPFYVAPQ